MRRIAVLCSLLVALAAGQYIEKYIPLPDSFGNIEPYGSSFGIALDPVRHRLYVPGTSSVLVVDAETGAKLDTLPVDLCFGPVWFDETSDKLYVNNSPDGERQWELLVFDGATNSLRARIPTGQAYVHELRPDRVGGKALCLLGDNSCAYRMMVLSTAGDSIVADLGSPGYSLTSATFNPLMNRYYVATYEEVLVIDGAADTLMAALPMAASIVKVCYNPVGNAVYCGSQNDRVFVVDCSLNVVVDSAARTGHCNDIVVDTVAERVFVTQDWPFAAWVYDAATNRVVDSMVTQHTMDFLAVCAATGKLYAAGGSTGLAVYDTRTLRQLARLDWPATDVEVSPEGGRAFAYGWRGLLGVDGLGDSLIWETQLCSWFSPLCHNPADGRVYGFDRWGGALMSLDVTAGTVRLHQPCSELSSAVCCSLYNKVFLAGPAGIWAYRCAEDSLAPVEWPWPPPYGPTGWHDAARHRVYVGYAYSELLVVDCHTDSVVARMWVQQRPGKMVADEAGRRLFVSSAVCGGDSMVTVIDVDRDSVIWRASMSREVEDIVFNPANNCLYGLAGSQLVVLDCERREVIATLTPTMRSPGNLVCSPRSGRVYVASSRATRPADTAITVIDCASQSVAGTITVGEAPSKPYYDAGRDRLYVPIERNYVQDAIVVIDCTTDSVTGVLAPAFHSVYDYRSAALTDAGNGRVVTGSAGWLPWVAVIRDTTPIGVEEAMNDERGMMSARATVVRGLLGLPASSVGREASSVLLDVSGRSVMELRAGENDVSGLAPGVYFVRGQGPGVRGQGADSVTKVVITR